MVRFYSKIQVTLSIIKNIALSDGYVVGNNSEIESKYKFDENGNFY